MISFSEVKWVDIHFCESTDIQGERNSLDSFNCIKQQGISRSYFILLRARKRHWKYCPGTSRAMRCHLFFLSWHTSAGSCNTQLDIKDGEESLNYHRSYSWFEVRITKIIDYGGVTTTTSKQHLKIFNLFSCADFGLHFYTINIFLKRSCNLALMIYKC